MLIKSLKSYKHQIQFKMSSFTPIYNPSVSMFSSNFFPWLSLESWNSNPFMYFPMKNVEIPQVKTQPVYSIQRKLTSSFDCSPVEEDYELDRQNDGFQIQQRKNGGRIQCKGRNDYSNILKAFIHLIKTNSVLKQKIKIIIATKQLPITYQRFLMRIRRKFSKGKTYISPKEILNFLKSCYQTNQQGQMAIGFLFKIILKQFLSLQYVLCLIKSFKGKKQSRKELIMKTRQLSKLIFQDSCDLELN